MRTRAPLVGADTGAERGQPPLDVPALPGREAMAAAIIGLERSDPAKAVAQTRGLGLVERLLAHALVDASREPSLPLADGAASRLGQNGTWTEGQEREHQDEAFHWRRLCTGGQTVSG